MSTGSRPRPSPRSPAPWASSAIAWAPPAAITSVTPSSAQAARIVGCGRPPNSFCGGEASTISCTPATCAGTTFITTELGSTARPPGTYRPTRRTGTQRWVTVPPGTTSTRSSGRRWAESTARTRAIASSRAVRIAGSRSARACSVAAAGTRRCSGRIPSKRSEARRTASAPRVATSSTTGRTAAAAASTSSSARGSAAVSSAALRVRSRRSMTVRKGFWAGMVASLGAARRAGPTGPALGPRRLPDPARARRRAPVPWACPDRRVAGRPGAVD